MMGSPNATVYRFHGIGLILDDLAHVAYCGVVPNVPPVCADSRLAGAGAGGGREDAGRTATDMGRDRTVPVGDVDPELLIVDSD